jgi:hypothetical protein
VGAVARAGGGGEQGGVVAAPGFAKRLRRAAFTASLGENCAWRASLKLREAANAGALAGNRTRANYGVK